VRSAPQPHGHALLADLLPEVAARAAPGVLIEVGTTREKVPGQGSTVILAELAALLGRRFITVDMDPANTEQAMVDLADIPGASAVTAKGEDFLGSFTEPVVAAYLDAFDIQHHKHSKYRIDRYQRFLGVEITNEGASQMHLECALALVPRLVPGGLIVIDDTWTEGSQYMGKGSTAVPALLHRRFTIAGRTPTAIALQAPIRGASTLGGLAETFAALPGRVVRRLRRGTVPDRE
jgi:hypothetical protein